jgi:hypothetical protein
MDLYDNKRNLLVLGVAVIIIISVAFAVYAFRKSHSGETGAEGAAHTPCQAGDNYDIYTGKPCE